MKVSRHSKILELINSKDIETQEEMINAVEMFIQLLRANPKFKEHFSNSLVSELE